MKGERGYLLVLFFHQYYINGVLQIVEFLSHCSPQYVWVCIEIPVCKDSSHTYDFSPFYFWMLIFKLWKVTCKSSCCLTDNVEIMSYPCLNQFIVVVSVSTFPGILHDANDSVLDIK